MKRGLLVRLGLSVAIPWALAMIGIVTRQQAALAWIANRLPFCSTRQAASVTQCMDVAVYVLVSVPFLLSLALVIVEYEGPVQRFAAFRRLYLDAEVRPLWEELTRRVGPGVRLNIMVAERCWYRLFRERLRFEYPLGFTTPQNHRDLDLQLSTKQGVAGLAYRTQRPQAKMLAVDPPPDHRGWALTPKQLAATQHVRWILSVPMFREGKPGEPQKARVRGVINIDATDDAAARVLNTPQEIGRLSESLLKVGRVASHLW